jgi:hypothetical protein
LGGHYLRDRGRCLAEDYVLLLKVADLLPRCHELGGLGPPGAGLEPAVDQVLLLPAMAGGQRRNGHPVHEPVHGARRRRLKYASVREPLYGIEP